MRNRIPVIAWILVAAMILSMAGCGVKEPQQNPSESGSEVQSGTKDSEEESESETSSAAETESESETESSTDTWDVPEGYTVTVLDKSMWATTGVNVRDLPDTTGTKIGSLVKDQEIKVTGQCNETGWFRVEYEGKTGFVSNKYLTDSKPVSNTPAPGEPNATVDVLKDILGKKVNKAGGLYVVGNAGFEGYNFNSTLQGRADSYASLMTKAADALKGVSNVYVMPIPLGSGVLLPDEYKGSVSAGDQGAAIDYILGKMGGNVLSVDIFGPLYEHREEYLYFRTDHHWTQLGAYYAYTEFCKVKGITPYGLDHFKHQAYTGFVGSFYSGNSKEHASVVDVLQKAPDTVYTYAPISNAKMTVTDTNGKVFTWPIINNVKNYAKGTKYSCFIAGDNPYTIIENSDIKDGSSCVVIKESYGNAFVPWLVDHYQTIYVIDQRYWNGNVISFAKEHNITDVIFANNLSAIGSSTQIKYFRKIVEE